MICYQSSTTRKCCKLDVKQAYWHVQFDKESSLHTRTWGEQWKFQRKLKEGLSGSNDVTYIADDLLVMVSGSKKEDADSDQ